MGKSTKTGREREPSRIQKGSSLARAFFRRLGIRSARDARERGDGTHRPGRD